MGIVEQTLGDKLVTIATRQLIASSDFKKPRMARIKRYEDLYAGKVKKKPRVQFNIPVPVFPGMIDTLMADLDEIVDLKFIDQDPADYKAAQKITAAWQQQSQSVRPGARYAQKFRWARRDLIFSDRGILKMHAQMDPFNTNIDHTSYINFHCEPKGGGHLESHLFAGEEGINRTASEIKLNVREGIYNRAQVKKLLSALAHNDYKVNQTFQSQAATLAPFSALNLNVEANNYVGEPNFNFCEWVLTYEGRRWYLVFEPYIGVWVRLQPLKEVFSNGYYPWVTWAGHENSKVFWSKSFADDLYPIADSINTLFNQEVTNRQKRNLNARAYDKTMFKNVEKLDEAQYRPDALVPVDTKNGTRRVSDGIYNFETPQITGTVELIGWMEETVGRQLGVTDIQQGASQPASKKVRVAFAELGQISKRLSFLSQPFNEVAQEIGIRFTGLLKDYMTEPIALKMLGTTGYEAREELRRIDLNTKEDLGVTVVSQGASNDLNEMEKAAKLKAFEMTAESPNVNGKARDEYILREIGGFNDQDLAILLDPLNDFSKELQSEAAVAIQQMIKKKTPPLNYGADTHYLQAIMDFAVNHRDTLGDERFNLFMEYIERHIDIARENMMRKKNLDAMVRGGMGPESAGTPGGDQPNAQPNAEEAPNLEMPGGMGMTPTIEAPQGAPAGISLPQ